MHLPIHKSLRFLDIKDIDAICSEDFTPDQHDMAGETIELGLVVATVFFKSGQTLRFLGGRDRLNNYLRELKDDKS